MRPFVGQWNQGQGHGAGMSRRCQAGQNTYALGCGSHAANGIEAPYLYAQLQRSAQALAFFLQTPRQRSLRRKPNVVVGRSEEHTSELQSLMRISYAVFCLTKKTK